MVDIKRALAISFDGKTWTAIPELVTGKEVVELCTTDTALAKFVTGSTRGLYGATLFDSMKQLRERAVLKAAAVKASGGLFDNPDLSSVRKRRKAMETAKELCREEDGQLPKFVEIDLPEMTIGDVTIKEAKANILTTLDGKEHIKMQVAPGPLEYVFSMLLHSSGACTKARAAKDTSTHTRWDRAKGTFVARNVFTEKHKSFKPHDKSAAAKDSAKNRAMSWAAAEPVADDDESCGSGVHEGSPSMQPDDSHL